MAFRRATPAKGVRLITRWGRGLQVALFYAREGSRARRAAAAAAPDLPPPWVMGDVTWDDSKTWCDSCTWTEA